MAEQRLDLRQMKMAITGARRVLRTFGTQVVTTVETSWLLRDQQVRVYLEDLPEKYAAMLSPVGFHGIRALALARHVPVLRRRIVLLHENGHLYTGTAKLGITYDNDDWRSPAEQSADAFAAIALIPRIRVDEVLDSRIWIRDAEDVLAGDLLDWTEGLWEEERALAAARNRLLIRHRLVV